MLSLRETIWVMKHNDAKASEIWFRIINFANQLNLFYKEIKVTTAGGIPEGFEFKSEKALHIILVIQEAINNSVRHSEAKNILIESDPRENNWCIKIQDDGIGFNKEEEKKSMGGNGLSNMNERALLAQIHLTITSEKEKGTSVLLNIPLD